MSSDVAEARVSVIIPLYNMGAYIGAALDSVLAQTFPDWDAWIVDDGSTDDGPEIARRYAAQHSDKIHYLEHDGHANRGVSASRNLALDRSRGEFVAFLDADDLWMPDKLEKQMRVLDAHTEVGLVYSSAKPIRGDGQAWFPTDSEAPVKIAFSNKGEPRVGYGTPNQPLDLFDELVRHCCLVNSSVIVRRSVLDKAGRFEETMKYAEDWLLYTCAAYHTKTWFIDEPLISYRMHAAHFSASIVGNDLARLQGAAAFLEKLPERLGVRDARLHRLLADNRASLFGRSMTCAEEAWQRGRRGLAFTLAKFAWRTHPNLLFSRRTARFIRTILVGCRGS
jgi:glycosyltransferase involved in cell wall biosynthesis